MKKIISIVVAVCMLCALSVMFVSAGDPAKQATVIAADNYGYGIIDYENDKIVVHLANDDIYDRVKNHCTFRGLSVGASAGDWDGTGIRIQVGAAPDNNGGKGCLQYAGIFVEGSFNDTAKTVDFKVDPQSTIAAYTGENTDTGVSFPDYIKEHGGHICVRIDTDKGGYLGVSLPVYEGSKPAGLTMTAATFNTDGSIDVAFNSEVDNVWDLENGDGSRDGTIYEGCGRFCAIRIVDNTTNWNLMWDGDKPAQWEAAIMDVSTRGWPFGYKTNPVNYGGHLGCNSFEDICNLVKPGGKFEGCVVTYCIEEMIGSNGHSDKAVGGDGYINSFFANGGYNDIKYVLKANKPVADGALDGAYVVMYDPNPKTADMTGVAVACAVLSAAAAAVVFARKKH